MTWIGLGTELELGITLFIIFSKINILTATQALLCSVALRLASKLHPYVYSILLSPIVIFVFVALSLELVHFLHKEKTAASRSVWRHVQDLRSKQDLELLLILSLDKKLITVNDLSDSISDLNKAPLAPATTPPTG
jgi:hypothetical protein